jgi:23S rRNA-/tRNA-specific pseudouridylate synthase
VLASLDNGNLSVLRFALETGRTHQVSRTFRPAAV